MDNYHSVSDSEYPLFSYWVAPSCTPKSSSFSSSINTAKSLEVIVSTLLFYSSHNSILIWEIRYKVELSFVTQNQLYISELPCLASFSILSTSSTFRETIYTTWIVLSSTLFESTLFSSSGLSGSTLSYKGPIISATLK